MSLARLLLAFLFLSPLSLQAATNGVEIFAGPEADAEASRLFERADDFVRNVTEGKYSYAYIQFHWKRAGANLDRIRTAYPDSPTAKRLAQGGSTIGGFAPKYFKERVLPRLEEKKVGAFDAVNCAIYLYGLDGNKNAEGRQELLRTIVVTLCRQIRWSEALNFPVLDRAWLWNVVVGQAAIYHNDKLVAELLANALPDWKPVLVASVAEGLAFRGEALADVEKFLIENGNAPALRVAALRGFVRREIQIERAMQANRPLKGLYDGVDGIQKPEQRVDIAAFAATAGDDATASRIHAHYLAATGRDSDARRLAWTPEVQAAYLEYLVLHERYEEALSGAATLPAEPQKNVLVALARAGATKEAARLREKLARVTGADVATYEEFRGRMFATDPQLTVREHTFADLPLGDPNLTGRLICEWSLTPNRSLRGAAPWDAVVFKFSPGFENLPEPLDKRKIKASGG